MDFQGIRTENRLCLHVFEPVDKLPSKEVSYLFVTIYSFIVKY